MYTDEERAAVAGKKVPYMQENRAMVARLITNPYLLPVLKLLDVLLCSPFLKNGQFVAEKGANPQGQLAALGQLQSTYVALHPLTE